VILSLPTQTVFAQISSKPTYFLRDTSKILFSALNPTILCVNVFIVKCVSIILLPIILLITYYNLQKLNTELLIWPKLVDLL